MSNSEQVLELCRLLAGLNYDGQQTIVSPESFAKPNFNLVCDILAWMAAIVQLDRLPATTSGNLPRMVERPEAERVSFLVSMGKLFRASLAVELNLVNLYRADSSSCGELVKVADLIYRAAKLSVQTTPEANSSILERSRRERGASIEQLSQLLNAAAGDLEAASQLDNSAALLESLLQDELAKFNEDRSRVMDRRLELKELEKLLVGGQAGVVERTRELARANEELERDLRRLDKRLELKEMELETTKGKLDDLLIQSPVYLGQYEKLRRDYEQQYEAYVCKFRNVAYLKACVYGTQNQNRVDDVPCSELTLAPEVGDSLGGLPESNFAIPATSEKPKETTTANPEDKPDRPGTAGDTTGLELEGLLNEFVADSAAKKEELDEEDDAAGAGETTFDDDDDDATEDDDDSLVGGF